MPVVYANLESMEEPTTADSFGRELESLYERIKAARLLLEVEREEDDPKQCSLAVLREIEEFVGTLIDEAKYFFQGHGEGTCVYVNPKVRAAAGDVAAPIKHDARTCWSPLTVYMNAATVKALDDGFTAEQAVERFLKATKETPEERAERLRSPIDKG